MMKRRLAGTLLAVVLSVGSIIPAHAAPFWTDDQVIGSGGLTIVDTEANNICPVCGGWLGDPPGDPGGSGDGEGDGSGGGKPVDPDDPDGGGPGIDVPDHPCTCKDPCCKPDGFDPDDWDGIHCPCHPELPKEECECPPGCTCDPDDPPPGCDCVEEVIIPPTSPTGDVFIYEDELTSNLEIPVKNHIYNSFKVVEPSPMPVWAVATSSCTHIKVPTENGGTRIKCLGDGTYDTYGRRVHYGQISAWLTEDIVYDIRYVQNDSGAAGRESLAVMRQGSKAMAKYTSGGALWQTYTYPAPGTRTSTPSIPKFGNPFSDISKAEWIAHRFAGIKDSVVLAKYMDKNNQEYINYMNSSGSTPKQLTNGALHSYNIGSSTFFSKLGSGGTTLMTEYEQDIYQEAYINGSGSGCTRGMTSSVPYSGPDEIVSSYADRIDFGVNVGVYATYAGKPLEFEAITGEPQTSHESNTKTPTNEFKEVFGMTKASPVFEFYPTYQMTVDYTAGVSPYDTDSEESTAWLLGQQKRKFQAVDYLKITAVGSDPVINTPWSRDSEDKDYGYPVSKAGSAYEFRATDSKVVVDAWFHLIDPKFAISEADANAINKSQIDYADSTFQAIINYFNQDDSVAVYSNVSGASTENSSAVFDDSRIDWDKEQMIILENDHSATLTKTYMFLPGVNGAQTFGREFQGNSMSVSNASWPGYNRSQEKLTDVLEEDGGYTERWYNEDYEGIIIAHYQLVLDAPVVQTDYSSWFKYQSDWDTAINETSPTLTNESTGNTVIRAEDGFVTGVEFKLGTVNWGQSRDVNIYLNPYYFGLRGNALDNA